MRTRRIPEDLHRVQFEAPPSTMTTLLGLKTKMSAPSYTEVLRTALRVLNEIHERVSRGDKLYVKSPDGEMIEIKFIF
ncbi:MAG: hypothetical protein ACD_66C00105G0004 [uncultured bacterium]|nr:MAG: hypothetical protein ACD_66C00105G0004 [uncultured bacterium]